MFDEIYSGEEFSIFLYFNQENKKDTCNPNDVCTNFTVRLPHEIKFVNKYEVAVKKLYLHLPTYDIPDDVEKRKIVITPPKENRGQSKETIYIDIGSYINVSKILTRFKDDIQNKFKNMNEPIKLYYIRLKDKIKISVASGYTVQMSSKLAEIFGFGEKVNFNADVIGKYTPKLSRGKEFLFLTTNIIGHSLLNQDKRQILTSFSINKEVDVEHNSLMNIDLGSPCYRSVDNYVFNEINIQIRDQNFKPISDVDENNGVTMIELHFRQM